MVVVEAENYVEMVLILEYLEEEEEEDIFLGNLLSSLKRNSSIFRRRCQYMSLFIFNYFL